MSGKCGPTLVTIADAAPDNWTFLGKLRPDEQAVDFFHACEHLGEVADRRDRLVRPRHPARRRRRHRQGRHYLRDQATTKTATAVLEREILPQAPHALREPQDQGLQGPHAPASSANKVLVNQRMKRARRSVDGGRNVLTFRALSGRFDAAWRPKRTARTTA